VRNDVYYQVFVRSFRDSDGDGIGDLRGITASLDHLRSPGQPERSLGVDGVWLTPTFPSPSYHGYDVTDFTGVNPAYGTHQDLRELVDACHRRGVRVLLDLVLNHVSRDHPWFTAARASRDAPTRDHFLWRDTDPGWTQPWSSHPTWHPSGDGTYYYGLFWGGMPDLNYRNPRVEEEVLRVAAHWLEMGVDGFRLDAVRYLVEAPDGTVADLPETHAFLKRLRARVSAVQPRATLVGEAWTRREEVVAYHGHGDELHAAFDFDLAQAIEAAVSWGSARDLREELDRIQRSGAPWSFEATFLSNHDMRRLASRLRDPGPLRAAVAILLLLPGTPFIYAGDEVGMLQGAGDGDEAKRTPMPWTPAGGFTSGRPWYPPSEGAPARNVASQWDDPGSLLHLHRTLISLRHAHPALGTHGALAVLPTRDEERLALLRHDGREAFLVTVNTSDQPLGPEDLDLARHLPGPARPDPRCTAPSLLPHAYDVTRLR
jgi:glycosidase